MYLVSNGINTSNNIGEYNDDGTNGWDNLLLGLTSSIAYRFICV